MRKNSLGLTVLESLVVMAVCVVLLWVVVPVAMVRLGYKEAGSMVVIDNDKAPEGNHPQIDSTVMKPRVDDIVRPRVLPDSQEVPRAPVAPKKNPLDQ